MPVQMLQAVQSLFLELHFCSSLLIGKQVFIPILDRQMESYFPLPDEILDSLSYQKNFTLLMKLDPIQALKTIEKESPLLLNRDLAAVALVRLGQWTQSRADRLCGLMDYEYQDDGDEGGSDGPYLSLEAALALCHPNNQERPLSRWWKWSAFLDLLDMGLKISPYQAHAAEAYLWAHQQQGGVLSETDPVYCDLVASLESYLKPSQDL